MTVDHPIVGVSRVTYMAIGTGATRAEINIYSPYRSRMDGTLLLRMLPDSRPDRLYEIS